MAKEKNGNGKQLLTETETGRVNFNVFWVDIENSNSMKGEYKKQFGKNPQEATITTPEIRKVVFSLLEIESKRGAGGSGMGAKKQAIAEALTPEELKEFNKKLRQKNAEMIEAMLKQKNIKVV